MRLLRALAEYEHEPESAQATAEDLAQALFPPHRDPAVFAHVAEADVDGVRRVVGSAIWFLTFSTWTGRHGIWLEDLFVEPELRGRGLGTALLATLAAMCVERDYRRLEWMVLDWNVPSIRFYRRLGATGHDEWTTYRLDGDALARLGATGP